MCLLLRRKISDLHHEKENLLTHVPATCVSLTEKTRRGRSTKKPMSQEHKETSFLTQPPHARVHGTHMSTVVHPSQHTRMYIGNVFSEKIFDRKAK